MGRRWGEGIGCLEGGERGGEGEERKEGGGGRGSERGGGDDARKNVGKLRDIVCFFNMFNGFKEVIG